LDSIGAGAGAVPIEQYEKAFGSETVQGDVAVTGAHSIAEKKLETFARPPAPQVKPSMLLE
jgi:hypothetical protein